MARQLYFSKEKINTLIKMENLIMKNSDTIFGKKKNKITKVKWFDGTITTINYNDYMNFNNIIEQLINAHAKNIKKHVEYKKNRRKIDKMYGRSKKEKEQHERAIAKKRRNSYEC